MIFHNNLHEAYFSLRNVDPTFYSDYIFPSYLLKYLPKDKAARILDIGCGFGQMILALKKMGYVNVFGIDISNEAINYCVEKQINVLKINNIIDFINSIDCDKYNLIIMSHVLEHIEKNMVIPTLRLIKNKLLNYDGQIAIMVPNAQSNTGCYWAYEDFTHTTLFTAGSLFYVLKASGFEKIILLDQFCLDHGSYLKILIKKILLRMYILNNKLWNKVTSSSYHQNSPQVFSYEIKIIAK